MGGWLFAVLGGVVCLLAAKIAVAVRNRREHVPAHAVQFEGLLIGIAALLTCRLVPPFLWWVLMYVLVCGMAADSLIVAPAARLLALPFRKRMNYLFLFVVISLPGFLARLLFIWHFRGAMGSK